jgi:hypothetical protein
MATMRPMNDLLKYTHTNEPSFALLATKKMKMKFIIRKNYSFILVKTISSLANLTTKCTAYTWKVHIKQKLHVWNRFFSNKVLFFFRQLLRLFIFLIECEKKTIIKFILKKSKENYRNVVGPTRSTEGEVEKVIKTISSNHSTRVLMIYFYSGVQILHTPSYIVQ